MANQPSTGSMKARLCDALVAKGLLTKQQVRELQRDPEATGRRFGHLLVERGLVTEEKLFAVLAEELSLPMLSLAKYRMDPQLGRLIPERIARQYMLVPVSKLGDRLVVAMSDPMNIIALEDLAVLTQYAIDPVLAQEPEIRHAIEQLYGAAEPGGMLPMALSEAGEPSAAELDSAVQKLLADETSEVPVVKVINMMIMEALLRRASDIHLEPLAKDLRVRYRIDGRLVEGHRLPKAVQNTVLTRLKIISGLDIAEWRVPQDGRFKIRLEDKEVDFRVSTLPLVHGAKCVLRVLDKRNLQIGLDQLGLLPDSIAMFQEAIKRPYGMILVTGPTGSGKSTTLYSILTQLNSPARHITTIEDPVEYQVEGITQVQVNAEIGLTFADGLRALLRQSPDVVMIGEIRDTETADIALKASLTGQLVLSTLHTNDAASAVTRMVDMGVEPFLVASSVSVIEAQRLVRKLCLKCRKPYDPPPKVWEDFKLPTDQEARHLEGTFFQAAGCHSCNGTGYRGRMCIVELFLMDERVRELIVTKAQSWQIKEHALKHLGLIPLRQDGLRKAAAGLTSLEEVLQATTEE